MELVIAAIVAFIFSRVGNKSYLIDHKFDEEGDL